MAEEFHEDVRKLTRAVRAKVGEEHKKRSRRRPPSLPAHHQGLPLLPHRGMT